MPKLSTRDIITHHSYRIENLSISFLGGINYDAVI
jgi:hypothetical protein